MSYHTSGRNIPPPHTCIHKENPLTLLKTHFPSDYDSNHAQPWQRQALHVRASPWCGTEKQRCIAHTRSVFMEPSTAFFTSCAWALAAMRPSSSCPTPQITCHKSRHNSQGTKHISKHEHEHCELFRTSISDGASYEREQTRKLHTTRRQMLFRPP